jgi:hypothetical protein
MLAYVIIAVELLILYTVFWYVFLREPKPYSIKGNAWGVYDGPNPSVQSFAQGFHNIGGGHRAHGDNCGCQADNERKVRSASAIHEEWHASSTNVPLTAGELIRSQTRGVERVNRDQNHQNGQQNGQQNDQQNGQRMQYQQQVLSQPHYMPHNPTEQYRTKYSKSVPAFLAELGDVLNRINVKLP